MQKTALKRLESLKHGTFLFVLCWIAYYASYIGRYNYSAAMGELLDKNVLSISAAGAVSTAYFLLYGIGQLVNGFLSSKISPYTMISFGLFCAGLSNVIMGIVPTSFMVLIWAFNGFFQSMIWPPMIRLFAEALPKQQQKKACTNITSTSPLGTVTSYALCAVLLSVLSWQWVFYSCGAIMIGVSVFVYFAANPLKKLSYQPAQAQAQAAQAKGKASIPLSKMFIASGIIWILLPVALHGALKDGVTSWVPTFVQNTFATTVSFSAAVSIILPIVNLSGAYIASWLDTRFFKNELKTVAFLFFVACAALGALPFVFTSSIAATMVLLAITTSSMLGINTLLLNVLPVRAGKYGNAAAISGTLNAIAYLGAAMSTGGIGAAIENFGWTFTVILWLLFAAVGAVICLKPIKQWHRFLSQ